jgi:hypothetical protein
MLLTLRWYLVIIRTAKYRENSPWIKNYYYYIIIISISIIIDEVITDQMRTKF